MKGKIFLAALALASAAAVDAAAAIADTLRIVPQRNERWWWRKPDPDGPYAGRDVSMMLSDAGRYVWCDAPFSVDSVDGKYIVAGLGAEPELVKGGRNLRQTYLHCVHSRMWRDGRHVPQLPAMPVVDAAATTGAAPSDAELSSFAEAMAERGVSGGTIIVGDGWRWGDGFSPDRNLYGSLGEVMKTVGGRGFDIMFTVTPCVPACGRLYLDCLAAGALVTDGEGRPLVVETGAGYAACLDITDGDVSDAFSERLSAVCREAGIETLLFDGSVAEALPEDMRRRYYECWDELAARFGASLRPAATCTDPWQPFMVTLGPEASWNALSSTLSALIDIGLTGRIYPFMRVTLGAAADPLIRLRAMQLAMFMPLSAIPPAGDVFGDERLDGALAATVASRLSMDDYFRRILDDAASTGEPMMRHMEYQFPDQGFHDCRDQFMLGGKCLVAPVLDDSGRRMVRLPKGMWVDADGKRFRGPRVIGVDVSDGRMPVFVQP